MGTKTQTRSQKHTQYTINYFVIFFCVCTQLNLRKGIPIHLWWVNYVWQMHSIIVRYWPQWNWLGKSEGKCWTNENVKKIRRLHNRYPTRIEWPCNPKNSRIMIVNQICKTSFNRIVFNKYLCKSTRTQEIQCENWKPINIFYPKWLLSAASEIILFEYIYYIVLCSPL